MKYDISAVSGVACMVPVIPAKDSHESNHVA